MAYAPSADDAHELPEKPDRIPDKTEKPKAPAHELEERGRGRHAARPTEIPAKGWLDIFARTKQQVGEDNLDIVSAGVAFYGFVAVVPALAAVIAVYGLVSDPSEVAAQIESLAQVLPREALPMLHEQMLRITSNGSAAGWSALIGFALALYSANKATSAMITGLNIAYDELEHRKFFKLLAISFLLTIGALIGAVLAVSLVAVLPSLLQRMNVTHGAELMLNLARWPILVGGFMGSLAVMYRFGPCRHDAKWVWVSPGAIVSALLWLVGSGLFSLYVSKFASYDKTYGPLGTVVIFMMWLYLSAFVILLGAELNSEMERQTKKDTTRGTPKPLGERGANAADTVGPSRDELREKKKK
ncbi:MAG TPA: YihY/virulence factor BrkB family protein [Opitutaceae bacterium]|nr:YihY/virulence factor BrkB family protein [Opitutaceae bacterium]